MGPNKIVGNACRKSCLLLFSNNSIVKRLTLIDKCFVLAQLLNWVKMTVHTRFLWKSVEFLRNLKCKDCIDLTRTVHNNHNYLSWRVQLLHCLCYFEDWGCYPCAVLTSKIVCVVHKIWNKAERMSWIVLGIWVPHNNRFIYTCCFTQDRFQFSAFFCSYPFYDFLNYSCMFWIQIQTANKHGESKELIFCHD